MMRSLFFAPCITVAVATQAYLPPPQFIVDFANHHSLAYVTVYSNLPQENWIRYFKTLSKWNLQVAFRDSEYEDNKLRGARHFHTEVHGMSELHQNTMFLNVWLGGRQKLKTFLENREKNESQFWLVFTTPNIIKSLLQRVNTVGINANLYACQIESDEVINVYEAYKILETDPNAVVQEYTKWTDVEGLEVCNRSKWERRKDFRGAHLRVTTLESPPYITSMTPRPDGTFDIEGIFAEVFFNLQEVLNFSSTIVKPPDFDWGTFDGVGWSGMVGLLIDGEVDLAVTDFTVTEQRSHVISFATSIIQAHNRLVVKNPVGNYNYKAYIQPLHWMAWVVLAGLMAVAPVVLYITVNTDPTDGHRREFTLGKSYVFGVSMLILARPWDIVPSSWKARLAFGSILLGGTLVFWHWEAMLISFLAARIVVLPFLSLQGLVKGSDYNIIVYPGTSYVDSFKFSHDPIWTKAWKTRMEPFIQEYPRDNVEIMNKLLTEDGWSWYENFETIRSFREYVNCDIIDIPTKYDVKPYAFGTQKDSPLLGPINFYLNEMRESGSLKQIIKKYEPPTQSCPDYSGKPLGFDNCFTAFGILIIGATVCVLVFIIEAAMTHFVKDKFGKPLNILLHWYDPSDPPTNISYEKRLAEKEMKIIELERKVMELRKVIGRFEKQPALIGQDVVTCLK